MFGISEFDLTQLRKEYPAGTRVELIEMQDPYMYKLHPGCLGTVENVDDIGTIHVAWDVGSSLGVAFGVDKCRKVNEYEVTFATTVKVVADESVSAVEKAQTQIFGECDKCHENFYIYVDGNEF